MKVQSKGPSPHRYHSHPLGEILLPLRFNPAEDSMVEPQSHIDAIVTQLFYTSNVAHDLFYRYGFTEAAGRKTDTRCWMYLWNTASPYPDGDMEAGIVIHELAHGLSTRLTGGPKNSGCLSWGKSGGMGEDFIATSLRSTSIYSNYAMGAWVSNRECGIRNYIYSLNTTVNPSTYKTLDKPGYWGVHAIGGVWAEMLWVVQQRLIGTYGFSETLLPPTPNADGSLPPNDCNRPQTFNSLSGQANPLVPKHGNTLLMQLVLNGMKRNPVRPVSSMRGMRSFKPTRS
ncbi:hypothetical protein PAXINDRAFT_104247 [Paxillus involutus ATCC 200175]|uniref:Extracellular metalloproteinase n=1 Tax=Paxillus involutus ATCC 200175 TaxID=664439 RepID=A0A0C9TAK1_PAXIN|nr:hypothetical protein PAXINDRAFT_104247 [Paxillus involutus ATCC 200175]